MVAAPAGLVGVVTAALHGELIQPGAVGALVSDGGKRSPHRAGVCHHLQATPAGRGGGQCRAGAGGDGGRAIAGSPTITGTPAPRMGRVGGWRWPSRAQPHQITSAQIRGGRKVGFSCCACELPCPSQLGTALHKQSQRLWFKPRRRVSGDEQQHPTLGVGTRGSPDHCPPPAVLASLLALKTGPSRANRDIEEEIIERGGILRCPSLDVYFPGCCHFSSGSTGPSWSSFIPASLSPALIPSLHSCCYFIIPLLSFLPSMLLLSTFSSHSVLCSHTFWGKHHLLLYFPLLDFAIAASGHSACHQSSHRTLSTPIPSF